MFCSNYIFNISTQIWNDLDQFSNLLVLAIQSKLTSNNASAPVFGNITALFK